MKNNQNFFDSTVSDTTIESHSPVFQIAKIRHALPFILSLIIGNLCPIGSHEYSLFTERSKLDSSMFMITSLFAIKSSSSVQNRNFMSCMRLVAYFGGLDEPFLYANLISFFTKFFIFCSL